MKLHHNLKPAMQWLHPRRILLGLALVAVAGCGGSDSDTGSGSQPGVIVGAPAPQTAAASCAGADLSGLKSIVYVSPQGADNAGCGATTAAACKTIGQGIANCATAGCGVLVRHGLYPTTATIPLRDAVNVYGSCRFDGEADRKYRTLIQAAPAPGTPALGASGINAPTMVSGLVVLGKDETAAGTASIALAVSSGKALTLTGSVLIAGKGGDGATGATPQPGAGNTGSTATLSFNGTSGWSGAGGTGAPACSYAGLSAGAGGRGADSNRVNSYGCFILCACDNFGGSSGALGSVGGGLVPGGNGGGVGGNGQICSNGSSGLAVQGGSGHSGSAGSCQAQGGAASVSVWGTLSAGVWRPGAGNSGGLGNWGSGGGGGGAGGVCTHTEGNANAIDFFGLPGGGGGSGGCGGPGGLGGQQGGASISVVLTASQVAGLADQVSVIPGVGGAGGAGGQGSAGGSGGAAGDTTGNGYATPACSQTLGGNEAGFGAIGGPGGPGGQGGAGSGGAGGNGGPSIGIALVGGSPNPSAAGIYPALAGAGASGGSGGQGGAGNCSGATGAGGIAGGGMAVVDYDLPLASILLAGQQLAKGQSVYAPGGKVGLILQSDDNFCLYSDGNALWCSQTNGQGIPAALMRTDGNFCMYPTNGSSAWCSGTPGNPGAYLIVQDSGLVQIIDGSKVLWSKP